LDPTTNPGNQIDVRNNPTYSNTSVIASIRFPAANLAGTQVNTINSDMLGSNGNPGANNGTVVPPNGGQVANSTSYNGIVINPNTAYSVVVPTNGFVTISWNAQ
jgi:hypothetical protein